MKAITIQQPWAWLIVHGHKHVENRTWRSRYRGELAIHAGKSRAWLRPVYAGIEWHWLRKLIDLPDPSELAYRAVVGTVRMVGCWRVEDYQDIHRAGTGWPDPFASGPWCHIYEQARAYDRPVACGGGQSLWTWDGRASGELARAPRAGYVFA